MLSKVLAGCVVLIFIALGILFFMINPESKNNLVKSSESQEKIRMAQNLRRNKKILSKSTIYVRYMDDITYPRFEYFDNLARGKGKFVTTNLGRGQVGYISAKDCKELIQEEFLTNPFLLTQGSGSKEFPNFKKEQTYVPVKDKYE